ncbi:hypothetical protein F889_01673 [Acinetobacter colistiniresistens]|uniref:DUF2645 family protein n=1 Tax=Acinetobacter colistiniresistens TaxID=280145 RepID=N9QWF1_9GAMM|nr:hypothetical protein F889_01673 [Acinetobacter colistiniresistens]EPG36860.1 hypothetical protein F907_02557 [Acinetobacter colistiniresistens]TVT78593.1 hypothetical protein FPV60_16960 [Acinetobacter colistiniresistens]
MKKIIYPILSIILVIIIFFGLPLIYEFMIPHSSVCAEGCDPAFRKFVFSFGLISLIIAPILGYLLAKKTVNRKNIYSILAFYLMIYLVIVWYSTGYGYGLNLSY